MSENPGSGKQSAVVNFVQNAPAFVLAFLLVFAVRSSIVEPFKIPSGSMIPTLLIGDHIFVNKLSYGVKVPFTGVNGLAGRPLHIIERPGPSRGEIIVFHYPRDPSIHYIKRVIGIAGDKIEIKNKQLFINDKALDREPKPNDEAQAILKTIDDQKYSISSLELFTEKLDTHPHTMMLNKETFAGESFGPITVPEKSLFVMGDNRDFSNDSRFWGYVPLDNVEGRAMFIWLSLWIVPNGMPWEWEFTFRPSRVGTILK